jgi:hypothetical protein
MPRAYSTFEIDLFSHKEIVMTASFDIKPRSERDFSLRKVANLLMDYSPPPIGDFEPSRGWRQSYTIFDLEGAGNKVGEFSVERRQKRRETFTLILHIQRIGNSGYSQFQHAEIQCRADTLATPLSWIFDTKMARNPNDTPYLESGKRCSAGVSGGALAIRDGLRMRRTSIDYPYSSEWTLLEAVHRLPGEKMGEMKFTLIDGFDTSQPGHRLFHSGKTQVKLQSGLAELTSYCDVGPAVLPTTYWVDEHHRLLFVCAGLRVYALNASNGRVGKCPIQYQKYLSAGLAKLAGS